MSAHWLDRICCLRRRVGSGTSALKADERGVTAIEFAIVAGPFFMLLFGIISVGFYFFTQFTLENGVETAARLIRTGQMQTATTGTVSGIGCAGTDPSNSAQMQACFKTNVCSKLPGYVDCTNKVRVNVQFYSDFTTETAATHFSCLDGSGNLVTAGGTSYNPGAASNVVLVAVCYQWDFAGQLPFLQLGQMSNGAALMQASTVFMTEPYN